jgi:CheY-like chemotaxis protein
VKNLTELHGGTVNCSSNGKGKGSRFTVRLPRHYVVEGMILGESGHACDTLQSKRPLRILVVDDNEDAAQMLALYLETMGHQVLTEHSSHGALGRARLEKPEVYILDIGLPDMDGNELARHLRAEQETAHAFLIAVTGYGQEHDRRKAIAAGFDQHLVKPVDVTQLAILLDQLRP